MGALMRLSFSPVTASKMPVMAAAAQSEPALAMASPATPTCTRRTWPESRWARSRPMASARFIQGLSSGFWERVRSGALTTPLTGLPPKALTISVAISAATRACASSVDAPRCGVAITLGCLMRGHSCSSGGSDSNTSRAAPATWPASMEARSAASSMMPPRAQLTMRTPGFIVARVWALTMLRVSSRRGTWIVKKSARRMHSAADTGSMPIFCAAAAGNMGS
mmetsp:Transcript_939/g.2950  ORF Transcript_939/g.2950 Transcript_939/m.2950 type:complete len:223 (-) Transcript_939:565-1233(-)